MNTETGAIRWLCQSCDWCGPDAKLLRAANPFDAAGVIVGCPACYAVDDVTPACSVCDCEAAVTCGCPTPTGYMLTCERHYAYYSKTT